MPTTTLRHVRVGIAGPSCSGKSTVAAILARRLGAASLCLDDLYLRDHPRRHVDVGGQRVRSYDHPGAYDGAAMLEKVEAASGPVVAEGFLLFAYPGLREAFDIAAYVDLPWTEVVRRRAARTGQSPPKVEAAFGLVGEAEWTAFGTVQRDLPGVVRLDGALAPEALADEVEAVLAARGFGGRRVAGCA